MGQDMSGTDAPFGFAPYGPVLRSTLYTVPTAPTIAIYHNDIVRHGGAGMATKYGPMVFIEDSANPDGAAHLLGSVLAVFDHNMLPVKYLAALAAGDAVVAGYVLVADDPNQLFIAQEDGSTNAIDLVDIGENANIVTTHTGNTNTGISKQEIQSSSVHANAALNVQIVRPHEDDQVGVDVTNCYTRWIVRINEHAFHDVVGLGI